MPIKLPNDFPAKSILEKEDIFAIEEKRAKQQDIRPLRLLLLNLMPNKIDTEIQLLRLISQSPLQIDVDFLKLVSHTHKNTSPNHLSKFYLSFAEIKNQCYDGLIITGAPVETLPFEEVDYWQELVQVMDWSQTNTTSVIHICWGAQAGLYHHHGIEKVQYDQKLFGIYPQRLNISHRLFRGFDDVFMGPQSRYTGINESQIKEEQLRIVAADETIGATILISADDHDIFLLGHFEYDTDSLKREYLRDQERGLDTQIPVNYFEDAALSKVTNCWRGNAHLLYHNWLNDVYQMTPYHLADIPKMRAQQA
ncbi:homoserine O-succinyltransferase [Enterococcus saccharolyticus]|uniref:Homoserine O-acetyltransferase n=1 Tax=Enterococcus saccharolyticus subsp. saccharolyticus ATCC 43076 TaxID=1139996 RepID=S0NW21_9ENTE|nr:homoserine O-succinyltransferase [Enterococcus saccharolyticus]EOT30148.1 homoserine O-succinyltransferase [Enterococcus saccharolyticus subsp. saccharolyticus ATCC 43076]EOT80693.1 homoserine O-succinyltransferase [Enterococcus saccharolyticus subsp. saccharolyticus ATCC 43076]OJG87853.1 homoserine O-succinyltransferase [Enterococcus saccharolyticus]